MQAPLVRGRCDRVNQGAEPQEESKGLPGSWKLGILALCLGIFLLADGPIWENPFDIDRQVYLSYLAIPPLVLLASVLRRTWSWRWLFLDTLELTCFKFGLTYGIAIALWAFAGAPKPAMSEPSENKASPARATERPPVPTPIANHLKAKLNVNLTGLDGEQAFVFIQSGLDHLHFPVPSGAVSLKLGTRGMVPRMAIAQTWQALEWSSQTSELHTAFGKRRDGRVVFNMPVMPEGRGAKQRLKHPLGLVHVQCSAHKHDRGDAESGHLLVLHHPFAKVVRGDTQVEFGEVPEGELVVAAWTLKDGLRRRSVRHKRNSPLSLRLSFAPSSERADPKQNK